MSNKPGWVDKRGSAAARRARRQWLLDEFGDGVQAPCFNCGGSVDADTMSVDRIIPGCEGGTYRRDNIRPACSHCQTHQGNGIRWGYDWRYAPQMRAHRAS